jgi:MoxR-like ATPase
MALKSGFHSDSIDTSDSNLSSVNLPQLSMDLSSACYFDAVAEYKNPYLEDAQENLLRSRELMDPQEICARLLGNFARIELGQQIIGRTDMLIQTLRALVAREHQLILSGPGNAKTLYAESVFSSFHDADVFKIQLTKGTPEEALIGPVDIRYLKNGLFRHNTQGSLVTADFAFLDEMFNANDYALLSLNSILQERKLKKGTQQENARLRSALAVSNVLRFTEQTEATIDRFIAVSYIKPLEGLLARSQLGRAFEKYGGIPQVPPAKDRLSLNEFDFICDIPANKEPRFKIEVRDHMYFLQQMILDKYLDAGKDQNKDSTIKKISDRTNAKSLRYAKVSALLGGRYIVNDEDLASIGQMLAPVGHPENFQSRYKKAASAVLSEVKEPDRKIADELLQLNDSIYDIRLAVLNGTHKLEPKLFEKICILCGVSSLGAVTFKNISDGLHKLTPTHSAVHKLREEVLGKVKEAQTAFNRKDNEPFLSF